MKDLITIIFKKLSISWEKKHYILFLHFCHEKYVHVIYNYKSLMFNKNRFYISIVFKL
jgi:hypothetical protein